MFNERIRFEREMSDLGLQFPLPREFDQTQGPAAKRNAPATPVINVSVNPGSKIKLAAFVDLLSKNPGKASELKGKIKLDKKTKTILVPDFSGGTAVAGKEWLFDLGKAGGDWEVSTARLSLSLDGPTSLSFQEDLASGEERGHVISADPDDSLLHPSHDITDASQGFLLGLTIPTQAMLDKNPPPADRLPPPQIARSKSGKGLILVARDIVVTKGGKVTNDSVAIPPGLIAMTFFHELAAHASFFERGLDAAHSAPPDPKSNPVDRNSEQAESNYLSLLTKQRAAMEKKVQRFIAAMNKAVP